MKLTVLIENKAPEGLIAEHGLSVFIEYNQKYYLLDAGASGSFLDNADKLEIDPGRVDAAVLSHAHYDHSGGYPAFFNRNRRAGVYLQSSSGEDCYKEAGETIRYIGIPKGTLNRYRERFHYVEGKYKLDEGVWLIPHNPKTASARAAAAHMLRYIGEGYAADNFSHEHSLVLEGRDGLVVLNSCCHSGADRVALEVMEAFPGCKIAALIGGFHLMGPSGTDSMNAEPEEVSELARRLADMGVEHIYTGHCTGDPAYAILKKILGEQIGYLGTGTVIEIN